MTRDELVPDLTAAESDPARDPAGTVRVHPDHDPADPTAHRMVRTHTGSGLLDDRPWAALTGLGRVGLHAADAYVDDWPVQPLADLAEVLGHPTLSGRR